MNGFFGVGVILLSCYRGSIKIGDERFNKVMLIKCCYVVSCN